MLRFLKTKRKKNLIISYHELHNRTKFSDLKILGIKNKKIKIQTLRPLRIFFNDIFRRCYKSGRFVFEVTKPFGIHSSILKKFSKKNIKKEYYSHFIYIIDNRKEKFFKYLENELIIIKNEFNKIYKDQTNLLIDLNMHLISLSKEIDTEEFLDIYGHVFDKIIDEIFFESVYKIFIKIIPRIEMPDETE